MITTLTGENSYGRKAVYDEMVTAFVADYGDMGLERLDGEEAPYDRLREALQSLPFLASKKLVVLDAPGKNKQFLENFEQLLANLPETTDVIIVEPKLDKRLVYYKYLRSKTDFSDFPELDLAAMSRWLTDRAKTAGGRLSQADATHLAERTGLNQRLLANELDKLLLYNPNISRQTIELLTDETPQSTIFQLLEAAFGDQPRRALALYEEQRHLKVEPAQLIAMLAWQLHVMALIKTAGDRTPDQIAREAKLSPYVVRKTGPLVRNLSLARLKQLISDLLAIDVRLKREPIDADEALQQYLLGLAEL